MTKHNRVIKALMTHRKWSPSRRKKYQALDVVIKFTKNNTGVRHFSPNQTLHNTWGVHNSDQLKLAPGRGPSGQTDAMDEDASSVFPLTSVSDTNNLHKNEVIK